MAYGAAHGSHAVVYHPDFALSPLPDGHRFPMPKDQLLFQRLQQLGWADQTFRPVYPDVSTLSLVYNNPTLLHPSPPPPPFTPGSEAS